jgi:glutaredoxin-like protein NrdH
VTVTVYTKPNCQPCRATKRYLRERGIPFEEASIEEPGNLAAAKSLGFMEAPVVVFAPDGAGSEQSWSGFRPDMLGIVAERAAA